MVIAYQQGRKKKNTLSYGGGGGRPISNPACDLGKREREAKNAFLYLDGKD